MADELGIKVFGDASDAAAAMVGLARTSDQSFDQIERGLQDVDRAQTQAGMGAGRLNAAITGLTAGLGAMAGNAALGAVQAGLARARDEFGAAIGAASDLNETIAKTGEVFGSNAAEIERWSQSSASSLGLSQNAALGAAATLADMFNTMELGIGPAMQMSTSLVELSADVASFHNAAGGAEEVLQAIRSGLIGEAEPMRRFGVLLSENAVQAKAMELGLGGANRELTEGEKVQARYAIIMAQTATAQGDFARNSGEFENQSRILNATLTDLRATIGQGLLPAITSTTRGLNEFLSSDEFQQWAEDVAVKLEDASRQLQAFVSDHKDDLLELAGTIGETAENAGRLAVSLGEAAARLGDYITAAQNGGEDQSFLASEIEKTSKDLDDMNNMLVVGEKILRNEWPSKEEFQQLLGLPWWLPASEEAADFAAALREVRDAYAEVQGVADLVAGVQRDIHNAFDDSLGVSNEYSSELDRLRGMSGQVTKAEEGRIGVTRDWIIAGLEAANTADELSGSFDRSALQALQFERHVDDLTAAHDRLRGALNPVEAALDVFEEQIRAGIPLTAEQTRQVQILGMAQQGLQQQLNNVTIAQGLAAAGFVTQFNPAVGNASGLMIGAVGAAGGLYTSLWTLTRQPWYVDVVIRQSVMAVGSVAGGNDEPGGFLPGTQTPLPEAPPPLPTFDVDAWVADIIAPVAGGSSTSSAGGGGGGGGGGAAAAAAQEAGISLANQIIEALVQSVLDGERSVEEAVAFVVEHLSELGITEEDLFAGLAASWRELQEEIALGELAGEDVSKQREALGILEDAIEAATGTAIEDFDAWATAVENATDATVGMARGRPPVDQLTDSIENARLAAEGLASADPFAWLERAQQQLDQLEAQIALAPVLGVPQEIVDEWLKERDGLREQIANFGAGFGEALATGIIDPEQLANLDQATRDLIMTILAPFVDPAVLEQIASAGVEAVEQVSAETLERLRTIFTETPEVAAGMLDELVEAVLSGALTFEQAMQLLADVPDETLRPALERMREQLLSQLATALLSLGPDSPEVQAILESLALIDAALEGVGSQAEETSRSISRSFATTAVHAGNDALTSSPAVQGALVSMSGGGSGFGGGGGGASFGAGGTAGQIAPGTFVAQIEIDRDNHERFIVDVNNRKMSRILG